MAMVTVTVDNRGKRPRQRAGVVWPAGKHTAKVSDGRLMEITGCTFLRVVGKPEPVKRQAAKKAAPAKKAAAPAEREPDK